MAKQVVSASILELLVWCRDESCLELTTISVSLACPHFLQTAASPQIPLHGIMLRTGNFLAVTVWSASSGKRDPW